MDLSAFYAAYRADGHGRAAYEPTTMVALVLYAFATRQRSSRAIERRCRQDVAYRVITGNASPEVNYEFDRIAREIVAEARATDQAEDELYGEARGDELPEQLRTP